MLPVLTYSVQVIKNAKGLAIFTTMRTGLWMSGAGGSGIIVGRLPDGTWSPPSGILLHTAGLGFLVGVDVYDCVLVINTDQAMEAFARLRCTVGGELSATAGPIGTGGMLETEVHTRRAPIYTYLKSKGFYAGVQIDGSIMLERNEENERFYNEKLSAKDILSGKVRYSPYELQGFFATLKAAEGDKNVDQNLLPSEAPPSDFELDHDGKTFGVPDKDDPDPYGVLQLEKEGMVVREAGTHKRASWEQFTFAPSMKSPVYDTFERRSINRDSRPGMSNSNRSSFVSVGASPVIGFPSRDLSKPQSPMLDMSTQTDDLPPPPSPPRSSVRGSMMGIQQSSMEHIPEDSVAPRSPSARPVSNFMSRRVSDRSSLSRRTTPPHDSVTEAATGVVQDSVEDTPKKHDTVVKAGTEGSDQEDLSDNDEVVVFEEAPVVHSIQKATVPQIVQKAKMVSVPRRGPPPRLPPRNPNRSHGPLVIDAERHDGSETGSLTSPLPNQDYEEDSSQFHGFDGSHNAHESGVPEETPEEYQRDPWAKVMQHHSNNASQDSVEIPGAFHSLPTTPDEHSAHHQKKMEEDDFS